MKNRISQRLIKHQNKLRQRALKAKDEILRRDYWALYHDAKDIEPEIREMVLRAENRTLIEMIDYYGLKDIIMGDQRDSQPPSAPPENEDDDDDKPADDDADDHDDDIPPRQLGLWE